MAVYSIIKKSELEGALRLDAEYYQPEYLELILKIKFQKSKFLRDYLKTLYRYPTFYNLNYYDEGVLVLKGEDISSEGFVENQSQNYISREDAKKFPKTILQEGDLIFSVRGFVGKVGIIDKKLNGSIISANLIRIVVENLSPYFLWIFLNSKYGVKQIERVKTITAQETIVADDIKNFLIPNISRDKQLEIEKLAKAAIQEKENSKSLYSQAENLLLTELGLSESKVWEDDALSYIVNLSDIKSSHRADAEYFQSKFKNLESRIKNYGAKKLGEAIENVPAKFNPKPNENYRYVELANINPSIGVIDGFSEVLGKEAPSRAKRMLKNGDVIVSSVEGSLEKVALANKEQEGYLASTGFFQFRSKEILPEVLLLLAKSIVFQMQLEKQCAGTILTAVPKEAVKNVLIPILPKPTQQKIADLVQKSHQARKKAKELLEEAKRKVEGMIEK